MKKFSIKTLSFLLCLAIISSIVPLNIFAFEDENDVIAQAQVPDMDVSAVNGVGNVLLKAANNSSEEENLDFSFSALSIDGKIAYAKFSNISECKLVIAVYSEEGQMLGSGITFVEANSYEAYVEIEIDVMPQYFVLQSFLLDFDNSALCEPFITFEYTEEFVEFKNKTVADFPENIIINFDDLGEDNFAALTDGTVDIISNESVNTLISHNEETGTYVFENIDATLSSLKKGDIFVSQTGDEIILVKISSIEVDESEATIIEELDADPRDYFKYIDVDLTNNVGEDGATVDMSNADENVSLVGYEPWSAPDDNLETQAEIIDEDVSASLKFPVFENKNSGYLIGNKSSAFSVKGSYKLQLSATFNIKCYYDIEWEWRLDFWNSITDDYFFFESTIDVALTGSVSIGAKIQHDIPLCTLDYVTPIGLVCSAEMEIHVEASAAVTLTIAEVKLTIGFQYDEDSGFKNLCAGPSVSLVPNITGDIEASFGINIGPVFSLIKVVEVELEVGAGISAKAELFKIDIFETSDDVIHFCDSPCLDGEFLSIPSVI